MLDKNPKTRITITECLEDPWLKIKSFETPIKLQESIVHKLRDFRAPK
jgi:serine/threonine protein kinase